MAYPIGPGAGPGVGIGNMPIEEKLNFLTRGKQWAGSSAGKMAGGSLFGMWLLDKLLQTGHEHGMRGIQREGMRQRAEMATPENLMAQMALPQAQEEESMARNALLLQLSGGVIGPSVAKGNRMIGG